MQQVDVNLALNVMNKLRSLSKGEIGITSNVLADTILRERITRPKSGMITAMRTQVFVIIKSYFPYATPETPIKLGQSGTHNQAPTHVKMIDRDALLHDLVSFIHELGATDLLPDALKEQIAEYMKVKP